MISCVRDRDNTTLLQRHRKQARSFTEPNSCFSDFSDSLNSLNLMKVLLHLGKTPVGKENLSLCSVKALSNFVLILGTRTNYFLLKELVLQYTTVV